jgi:hypothetical protein
MLHCFIIRVTLPNGNKTSPVGFIPQPLLLWEGFNRARFIQKKNTCNMRLNQFDGFLPKHEAGVISINFVYFADMPNKLSE